MLTCYSRALIEPLIALTYRCMVVGFLLSLLISPRFTTALAVEVTPSEKIVVRPDGTSRPLGRDLLIPPVLAVPRLEPRLTLETSFQAKSPWLPRRLLNTGGQHISWHVVADSPQTDIEVVNEGAMIATFPDPITQMSTLKDWYYRFRINYARPWEQSRYGIEYLYVGDEYDPPNHSNLKSDQGLFEFWGKWQFGVTSLRTSVSQAWDNVDLEPNRSRLTTTRGQMQLEIALPELPSLVFSYSRGSAWSSWKPKGAKAQSYWLDTLEATIYYERPTWQTMLTSTYTLSQDQLSDNRDALYLYHELSLIYRLTPRLFMSPAMRMSQHRAANSGVWTDSPALALSLSYQRLFDVVDLTADSSYTHSYSRDHTWDTHMLDTVVSMKWHFNMFRFGPAAMVFEVSYVDYTDTNFPTNSFTALTGGWSVEMTF